MTAFHLVQQLMLEGEELEEGEQEVRPEPCWMCEKEADQLIGKTDEGG